MKILTKKLHNSSKMGMFRNSTVAYSRNFSLFLFVTELNSHVFVLFCFFMIFSLFFCVFILIIVWNHVDIMLTFEFSYEKNQHLKVSCSNCWLFSVNTKYLSMQNYLFVCPLNRCLGFLWMRIVRSFLENKMQNDVNTFKVTFWAAEIP